MGLFNYSGWIAYLLLWCGVVFGRSTRSTDLFTTRDAERLATLQDAADYVDSLLAMRDSPDAGNTWTAPHGGEESWQSADLTTHRLQTKRRYEWTARQRGGSLSHANLFSGLDLSYKRTPPEGFFSARGKRDRNPMPLRRVPPEGFSSVRGKRKGYGLWAYNDGRGSPPDDVLPGHLADASYKRGPPEGFWSARGKRREMERSDKRLPPDWFSSVRGKRRDPTLAEDGSQAFSTSRYDPVIRSLGDLDFEDDDVQDEETLPADGSDPFYRETLSHDLINMLGEPMERTYMIPGHTRRWQ